MNIKSAEAKKNIAFVLLVTLWFVYFTGGKFINPFYIDWIFPSDTETHWLGWQFFKNQSIFNFPLFKNINYGMELGSSLVLNDSLAIMAIIFKPFAVFIPFEFQYFGLWIFLCFYLQILFSYLILVKKTNNIIFSILGSLFFALSPIMFHRLGYHLSLSGHWIILAYFFNKILEDKRKSHIRNIFIICFSSLIHFYFTLIRYIK